MSFQKLTKTVTAVVSERSSPFPPVSPWPLIYVLEVQNSDGWSDTAVRNILLDEIAQIRWEELCGEDGHDDLTDEEALEQIREGLDLHFVFQGDVTADVVDFRE